MTSRFMWTIVCDDIRQEVGNKFSYMGLYGPQIFVPALPATLPKLCAIIHLRTLSNDPFKRLALVVLKDDEELTRIDISEEKLAAALDPTRMSIALPGEETYLEAAFQCQFVPFPLEKPCRLRFRAETERETLKGGTIAIKVAVQTESQSATVSAIARSKPIG